MILKTERLFLREMTQDDFPALYAVLGDPENMQHYPHPFDEQDVRSWIERNICRYQTLGFGLWAVCIPETGEMIGDCGLTMQLIDGAIKPEIGYHIRRDLQRRGYAAEAASAVRDWAFLHTPFRELYAAMKYTNLPSEKTALAWGASPAGTYPDSTNGITKVYVLRRADWEQLRRSIDNSD